MKKIVLVLVVLGLTGCVKSIEQLRATPPKFTAESNKDVKKVAECTLHGWQNIGKFTVIMQPNNEGYTVYLNDQWAMADIDVYNHGSKVKYYPDSMLSNDLSDKFIVSLKNCI